MPVTARKRSLVADLAGGGGIKSLEGLACIDPRSLLHTPASFDRGGKWAKEDLRRSQQR